MRLKRRMLKNLTLILALVFLSASAHAEVLMENGATEVHAYITHGVLSGPAVERWATAAAAAEGFIDVRHTVEIVGTCSECAKG